MIGFLIALYKKYKLGKELRKAEIKIQDMMSNLKSGNIKDKYENPQREWALLQWEYYQIKQKMKSLP